MSLTKLSAMTTDQAGDGSVASMEARLARLKARVAADKRVAEPLELSCDECPKCGMVTCADEIACRRAIAGLEGEYLAADFTTVHPQIRDEADALEEWVRSYLAGADSGKRSWLLHGPYGIGKSWLLACAVSAIVRAGRSAQFVEVRDLLLNIRSSYGDGAEQSESKLIRRCYAVGVLALNDPPRENVSPHTRSVIEGIIDERIIRGRPILFAANLDDDGWRKHYGEAIFSRLGERYFYRMPFDRSCVDLRRVAP